MSDTRMWEPRPRGPFAPTAVVTGERQDRDARAPLAGVAVDQSFVAGNRAEPVGSAAARRRMVDWWPASFGGWTAGAGARGGSRCLGEEVR